jgi:hypothetical protein
VHLIPNFMALYLWRIALGLCLIRNARMQVDGLV